MKLIIQKFGGSSVADAARIQQVGRIIEGAKQKGYRVIAVVSARQGETDTLLSEAKTHHPFADPKLVDLLLSTGEMASVARLCLTLQSQGISCLPRTAHQIGLITNTDHTKAQIVNIDPSLITTAVQQYDVAVVAGFQGITQEGHISTLGRGGSDLSALALAAALKADRVEIYTDVHGIFTADPRIVEQAQIIPHIDFDLLLEASYAGAKIMQARSVDFARRCNIPFVIKSTFQPDAAGTHVNAHPSAFPLLAVDRNRLLFAVHSFLSDFQKALPAFVGAGLCIEVIPTGQKTFFSIAQDDVWKLHHLFHDRHIAYELLGSTARLAYISHQPFPLSAAILSCLSPYVQTPVVRSGLTFAVHINHHYIDEAMCKLHTALGLDHHNSPLHRQNAM